MTGAAGEAGVTGGVLTPTTENHLYSPHQRLVVQVPHGDVAVTAAGEADLGVGADGQGVAGGGRGRQLCLDAWGWSGQVPNGQSAGFPSHYQSAAIGEQFAGTDVVISIL